MKTAKFYPKPACVAEVTNVRKSLKHDEN
jgi:hypothetical protein